MAETIAGTAAPKPELVTMTHIIYALYAASFFVGISAIVAIVLNYIKRDDVRGTYLESHFRWQMRMFWFGLLWAAIGIVLAFVMVGFAVLAANAVWIIYRIAKGWLNLKDGKPMYVAVSTAAG